MKKSLLVLLASVTGCSGVFAQSSYSVIGTVPDSQYEGQTVYLSEYENHERLDSAVVTDGRFAMEHAGEPGLRRLQLQGFYADLIVCPGDRVEVVLDQQPRIGGAPLADSLQDLLNRQEGLYSLYEAALRSIGEDAVLSKAEKDRLIYEAYQKYYVPIGKSAIASFKANADNWFGCYALSRVLYGTEPGEFRELIALASPEVQNFPPFQSRLYEIEQLEKTGPGAYFVDFRGTDTAGNPVSLSDYAGQGKYVLVDFWASWCGPCREEVPNLICVHDRYADEGLVVLGINVRDSKARCDKTIEELKMDWPHIRTEGTGAMVSYGIAGIPHIMLIGPDGTILERNLRGDGIEAAVRRHLLP